VHEKGNTKGSMSCYGMDYINNLMAANSTNSFIGLLLILYSSVPERFSTRWAVNGILKTIKYVGIVSKVSCLPLFHVYLYFMSTFISCLSLCPLLVLWAQWQWTARTRYILDHPRKGVGMSALILVLTFDGLAWYTLSGRNLNELKFLFCSLCVCLSTCLSIIVILSYLILSCLWLHLYKQLYYNNNTIIISQC